MRTTRQLVVAIVALAAPVVLPCTAEARPGGAESIVYVTPAAEGGVSSLLYRSLRVRSTVYLQPQQPLHPHAEGLLLDGADLDDPGTVTLLQRCFDGGLTVGLVDADQSEATLLGELAGSLTPAALPEDVDEVVLVALRDDVDGDRLVHRQHLFLPRVVNPAAPPDGTDIADDHDAQWLAHVFGPLENDVADDTPPNDLTCLADSLMYEGHNSDSNGNSIQVINNIWAARSFTETAADYYYVDQRFVVQVGNNGSGMGTFAVGTDVTNQLTDPPPFSTPECQLVVADFDPSTTMTVTTYTSSVGFDVGGRAGYMNGPAFLVNPSMCITNSQTQTVPETMITYQTDPDSAFTKWIYSTMDGTTNLNNEGFGFTQHFIWAVSFCAYGPDQECITFLSPANGYFYGSDGESHINFSLTSSMPLPFNATSLGPPAVRSVNVPSASPGDTIIVTGQNFYLFTGVLIGGTAIPESNYSVTSGTSELSINVPPLPTGPNQSIVVNTEEGLSNTDVTIQITHN